MTDRENFLERWSRRKRAAEDTASPLQAPHPQQPSADESPPTQSAASAQREAAEPQPSPPAAPEFDLTKLPSLDSITAVTDVRAFLAPGVPQHLTRAALRRAWVADPAIRDFVGLQDYDWDFVTPGAIPGFDALPADFDVRKILSQVLGDVGELSEQAQRGNDESDQKGSDTAPPELHHPTNVEESSVPEPREDIAAHQAADHGDAPATNDQHQAEPKLIASTIVRRDDIAAPQHGAVEDKLKQSMPPRKHGGALPR
jgi:hypothetical protein